MINISIARGRMTQEQLAESVGVTRVTISNYETGKVTPSTDVLIKMADVLEVSTDYLLGRYGKINPSSDGKDSSLVLEKKRQQDKKKQSTKSKIKAYSIEIFDYWNGQAEKTKALVKHRTLTNAMELAVGRATKSLGPDFDYKTLVERYVDCFEKSKNMNQRTLQAFFGQKAYQKDWLICEEYTDDGSTWMYWQNRDSVQSEGDMFDE